MWATTWDKYPVPTMSMYPTIIPEDHIVTHKFIFGARIYTNMEMGENEKLESIRLPGLRKIRRNDVLVFNHPYGYQWGEIKFRINNVFCKRCIALPGDTLSILNGYYINHLGDTMGLKTEQRKLSRIPETYIDSVTLRTIPLDTTRYRWTVKNFGPLYIPRKGDEIILDSINFILYKSVVEYETNNRVKLERGELFLGDKPLSKYRFNENYYFMAGDNVMASQDSRYFGFVPEEFVIGVVPFIFYHKNRKTGEIKFNRTFKSLDID